MSSPADTNAESPAEKVSEESVLPLVQRSTIADPSTQKGPATELNKSVLPLPLKIEQLAPAKGVIEESLKQPSLEQKEGRRASHTLLPSHRLKRSADSSSSRSSSSSSSSSRSRSRSPDSSGSHSHSPPRSKQREIAHANPCRSTMGSRSTSESRSRSRSRSHSASSNSRKVSVGVSWVF